MLIMQTYLNKSELQKGTIKLMYSTVAVISIKSCGTDKDKPHPAGDWPLDHISFFCAWL